MIQNPSTVDPSLCPGLMDAAIHRFSNIVTDKMAMRNINIRRTLLAYDAPGRDACTVFKVLMWVLDAREMCEPEVSER